MKAKDLLSKFPEEGEHQQCDIFFVHDDNVLELSGWEYTKWTACVVIMEENPHGAYYMYLGGLNNVTFHYDCDNNYFRHLEDKSYYENVRRFSDAINKRFNKYWNRE